MQNTNHIEMILYHIAIILTSTILMTSAGGVPRRVYIRACLYGYVISEIQSTFDESVKDREWDVNCMSVGTEPNSDQCQWTNELVNKYHENFDFRCRRNLKKKNGFISSLYSHHNGDYTSHGDRRWRFECCQTQGVRLTDCQDTGFLNRAKQPLNYTVPHGYVLHGVASTYDRKTGDRKWKFRICQIRDPPGVATTKMRASPTVASDSSNDDPAKTFLSTTNP